MTAQEYKQQLLNQLYAPYIKCIMCPLGMLGRTNVVFGQGNPDAKLMIIGEGPGQDEDKQGLPFVGRSGKLLNKLLEALHTSRQEVFITNIVKCRPPENRKPLPLESETCKNLLLINQIKIIQPAVICTLGASALQGLLNDYTIKISGVRGKVQQYGSIPLIPTFHPAYILRNPRELNTLFEDLKHAIAIANQSSY